MEIAEGEITLVQLAVANESLDHAMHMVSDTFGTAILERSSRRLDGVRDHHDRRFLRPRARTGVPEVFLPHLEALFERLPVEEPLDRRPLLLLHDLANRGRQLELLELPNAF